MELVGFDNDFGCFHRSEHREQWCWQIFSGLANHEAHFLDQGYLSPKRINEDLHKLLPEVGLHCSACPLSHHRVHHRWLVIVPRYVFVNTRLWIQPMSKPRQPQQKWELDSLHRWNIPLRREILSGCRWSSIQVSQPHWLRYWTQSRWVDDDIARIWTYELPAHRDSFVFDIQADICNRVFSADCAVQADNERRLCAILLLQFHLLYVRAYLWSAYIYMNIFYGVIITGLEKFKKKT